MYALPEMRKAPHMERPCTEKAPTKRYEGNQRANNSTRVAVYMHAPHPPENVPHLVIVNGAGRVMVVTPFTVVVVQRPAGVFHAPCASM
jgi:hypothetical protein